MYDVGPLRLTVGLAYLETLWLRMSHKNKAICRDPLTAHFSDLCMGRVRKEEVEDDDDQVCVQHIRLCAARTGKCLNG